MKLAAEPPTNWRAEVTIEVGTWGVVPIVTRVTAAVVDVTAVEAAVEVRAGVGTVVEVIELAGEAVVDATAMVTFVETMVVDEVVGMGRQTPSPIGNPSRVGVSQTNPEAQVDPEHVEIWQTSTIIV